MTTTQHASVSTVQRRTEQVLEEMRTHPHQQELIQLAKEQLEDMNSFASIK